MNTRPLTPMEAENLKFLNQQGLASALLFVTATGLEKSILDATEPVRRLLVRSGIHDFGSQQLGRQAKVRVPSLVLLPDGPVEALTSLYRPLTKNGDPRFWPALFARHASQNDVIAVFVVRGKLAFLNLSRTSRDLLDDVGSGIGKFFGGLRDESRGASDELFAILCDIARRGPIQGIKRCDNAVGMAIEAALGITPNSSKTPDYRGIELKSGRSGAKTRTTLFACVPDWTISTIKSSRELLDTFGYNRDGAFKLYCSVSALRPNSQGLILSVDEAADRLNELARLADGDSPVVAWRLSRLEGELEAKHRETFWIHARSEIRDGVEWFHLESATHTSGPNVLQFPRLLNDGAITLDHLVKRMDGRVQEKGPLFKIRKDRLGELFLGTPRTLHFPKP